MKLNLQSLSIFLALYLFLNGAVAQSVTAQKTLGHTYISLIDVAQALGYSTSRGGDSLTLRTTSGVLVVFANSPDILYKHADSAEPLERSDQSLSVPVIKQGEMWYGPDELFRLLGFKVSETVLELSGKRLTLSFPASTQVSSSTRYDLVDLGANVTGLSFYAPGSAGPETLSLLLVDLTLLSLVVPEQQRDLDALAADFRAEKPLYLTVTALAPANWQARFSISQGDRSEILQAPYSVSVLQGDATALSPDAPVSGLVLLPDWVNLREPLELTWEGVTATVQFRR